MRQQLVFLLMCCVSCKNGVECDVVPKTKATTDYFSNDSSPTTGNSTKYVDVTDINKNDYYSTLRGTANLNNDIQEGSTPETTSDVSHKTSTNSRDITSISSKVYFSSTIENLNSSTTLNIPTTNNSESSTVTSTFGTSTTQYIRGLCSAPVLSYSELQVFWETDPNETNCNKTNIWFNCTRLGSNDDQEDYVNATFYLEDSNYANINNSSLSLLKGYQYDCMTTFRNSDNVEVSNSTSLIVPPGPSKINITTNNLNVTWTAPFVNQTLTYNLSITLLSPHHYVPEECGNGPSNIVSYTTNNTYFLITDYLPDYGYQLNVSTTFWDIHNSDDCLITTPIAAPGAPINVSVIEYDNAKNEKEYTIHWKMPCNSNGQIQKYHIILTNENQSTVVLDEDISTLQNETEWKLNLPKLVKTSLFKFELYGIGSNNETGESFFGEFMTVLPAPNVSLIESGSTYFTIKWEIPGAENEQFHIDIKNLGPRYSIKENCQTYPDFHVDVNNLTIYNYTSARPFYLYNATVTVVSANISGYLTVETSSSVPDAPTNLTSVVNETTLLSELNWDQPCNVNGIISNFTVDVFERYTEDQIGNITKHTTNSNEYSMILQLQASHIYEITVTILLEDGLVGKPAILKYATTTGFPGLPIMNVTNITNTSFVIEWLPPVEKTGRIEYYELNVTSSPRYNIPSYCSVPNGDDYKIIQGNSRNFAHLNALPYSKYIVQIRANTSRGYGNFSLAEFVTPEGVPETVRDVEYTIHNNLSEEYDAKVSIIFYPPCLTYGLITRYSMNYIGSRNTYPDDKGQMVIDAGYSQFTFKLQPEFNYTYYIWSNNEVFSNATQGYFNSPAGVPTFNTSISIPKDSISTTKAEIVLKKKMFNTSNGDVRYIALLLSETVSPSNQNFNKWNSIDWPTLAEGVKQLTDCFWNPFAKSDNATFRIGTESNCNQSRICNYCNQPLKEDTEYQLTIRVFTSNFYRDGTPIVFRTHTINQLAVILGVFFGILLFGIVAIIGFFVWKKRLYSKLSYIYPKKPSAKPLVTNSTAVIPKKFVPYFKNAQSKPEFLKEQFTELEEKSKEIQAQKSCQFSGLLENKRKNRYVNISPYDDTRVKLLIDEDDEIGSDYINASYVKGCSGEVEYIATQGPLPTTCRDFWKMVIQENVSIIVMVSQFIEKNKQKCYKYFPKNHENLIISDDMEIRCSTELHFGTYLVRNLQVRKDTLQVTVTHMQFLEWPDFNVPTGTEHMLQFIYQIRERLRIEDGIVIVHCSAGVGRTGTLIAADMLLQNVAAGKQIDVFNTVLELRKQRVMMVQTVEQYVYLHRLVADHIDRPPTPDLNEASDPVYENMDILKSNSESEGNSKKKEEESEF